MSVLKQWSATPGRVAAVYRYLLHAEGHAESRERLERLLSPASLLPDDGSRSIIRGAMNECVKMGLVVEDGERLRLAPELPAPAKDRKSGAARLPVTLSELLLNGNDENRDLAVALSWYLEQDVRSAPGDWESAAVAVAEQVGGDRLGLTNSNPYNQLEDWACFLGFACYQGRKGTLTPDPTRHLRSRVPEIFLRPGTRLSPAELASRLADRCPVFEGGHHRREAEERMGVRREREVSSTTAYAWFRLRDEGVVSVESGAGDADVFIFPDGDSPFRCSAVTWTANGGSGR